jgi:hypothetical protein
MDVKRLQNLGWQRAGLGFRVPIFF